MNRFEYEQRSREIAVRGERLPQSKLTDEMVKQIREGHQQAREHYAQWTAKGIAKRLGLHYRTVEKVLSYETWRHVRD